MRVIISYDISNNKVRNDFHKFITKYGYRLQFSVYEIRNGTRILNNVLLEIDMLFRERFSQMDSVYIFKISDSCDVQKYGYAENEEKPYLIV